MTHFNDQAAQWDSDDKIKMMMGLAEKTKEILNLSAPLEIMDFGCGTGLFGLEFADYASGLLGVDTSAGMLEVFNQKTNGVEKISSMLIDLEHEDLPKKFDLIVSSMAFHHLAAPDQMLMKMKQMLNPGGRMAIVDLDEEDGTFHPDNRAMGVTHHGFSRQGIEGWSKELGLGLQYHIVNEIHKNDKKYHQFLAVFSI